MASRLGLVAGLDVPAMPLDAELTDLLQARLDFADSRMFWYARRRRLAQTAALLLRSAGAALLTVGLVLPALREASPHVAEGVLGGLAAGYVFLGFGAAAVLVERYFGFSRIAPRLASAEIAIAGERELFLADWRIAGERPAPEARRARLDLARSFTAEINRIVRREMDRAGAFDPHV